MNESIFRSAPMTLVQFYVTSELARDVVGSLGQNGNVHFRDLNSKLGTFQRTFINELRNIDSTSNQLEHLYNTMLKHGAIRNELVSIWQQLGLPLLPASQMEDIRRTVDDIYQRIVHLDELYDGLELRKLKLVENRNVVEKLNGFHSSALTQRDHEDNFEIELDEEGLLDNLESQDHRLEGLAELGSSGSSLCATIETDKVHLLRSILWRSLRGNLYFHDIPISEPLAKNNSGTTITLVQKSVVVIYVHGSLLQQRVRKIVNSLDGQMHDNLGDQHVRDEMLADLNNNISDVIAVVDSTRHTLMTELIAFQDVFPNYRFSMLRERMVYETLNKFDEDSTRRCLVGEGWIPLDEFEDVKATLRRVVSESSGSDFESISLGGDPAEIPRPSENTENPEDSLIAVVNELATNRTPPTFHRTNKFTGAFQLIIDAYGIATYQEVNPGLATIITFPFMFAIMFGDLGHGFIVMLIACYLIANEVKFGSMRNKDEIFEMAFNGRYIILLMGLFLMYTGLIYNDIFSKSMSLFLSHWEFKWPSGYNFDEKGPMTLIAEKKNGTYPFGLDWGWHGAENNLLFTNSYKMKLLILMGFAHMNYSLFFSLVNYRYFKSKVDIVGNFIPGFLFMQSIFGYLVLTILYKWSVDWFAINKQPPGLLNMLINMFLLPGKIDDQLYPGQQFVQIVLVLVALCCVPWLLIYKPLVLKRANERAIKLGYTDLLLQQQHVIQLQEEEDAMEQALSAVESELNHDPEDEDTFMFPNDIEPLHVSSGHGDGDGFNLGDVVIHQVIHTIEFCLNCVSHTASYLRLWALSLAHAQLSTVLWSMTIQNAFGAEGAKGVVLVVCLFALWFVLTVCILVLMEGTSAMLHSLRLHWVEAMSKFFEGEGYAYEPMEFKSID